MKKQTLDAWLNEVNYEDMNTYVPSEFALKYAAFIKLTNGAQGESNKTPPMHLKMLDKVTTSSEYIVNLMFRGAAKTSIFAEYFFPFLAVFHKLPGIGNIDGAIYISDSMENGVKSLRKNMEFRYNQSEFLRENLPEVKFTDNYIEFKNKAGQLFGLKMFGATTGLRGTKIFGKRPKLAVLDDLISDEASRSKTTLEAIKDTIYKGVNYALDPMHRKVIFNGTPFDKQDPIIEAVESGAWEVNVYPVCEKFPCEREEYRPAWEDRFSYDFVLNQYNMNVKSGRVNAFYQEMMLRINNAEDRLIQDSEIRWYSRIDLLQNKANFNFYITTDFATSAKQTADFSVISVWAYNNNGDWFWVDGTAKKQTMDKNIDKLFEYVSVYQPASVGVEITGQQGAFIQWLQKEMMTRNIWFNLAGSKGTVGIRPTADKLTRLNMVIPWFKAGKMFFPQELKATAVLGEFLSEISLATSSGIKGHDDCIDTISMLAFMNAWKPSFATPLGSLDNNNTDKPKSKYWAKLEQYSEPTESIQSYIV